MVGRVAQIIGQIGTNTKGQLAAAIKAFEQLNGLGYGQAITEDQHLGQGINLVGLVMGNQALAPVKGVTAVMARAIKQFAKVQVEVTQECGHAINIGQGDTQITAIFTRPGLKAKNLAVTQTRAQRLAGLQILMRQRTQRDQTQLHGIQHIAGTRQLPLLAINT